MTLAFHRVTSSLSKHSDTLRCHYSLTEYLTCVAKVLWLYDINYSFFVFSKKNIGRCRSICISVVANAYSSGYAAVLILISILIPILIPILILILILIMHCEKCGRMFCILSPSSFFSSVLLSCLSSFISFVLLSRLSSKKVRLSRLFFFHLCCLYKRYDGLNFTVDCICGDDLR